jgi:hypothetical protein
MKLFQCFQCVLLTELIMKLVNFLSVTSVVIRSCMTYALCSGLEKPRLLEKAFRFSGLLGIHRIFQV